MQTKKTTVRVGKKPAKKATKPAVTKDFSKQQKQMASSVGPLLTIIGVLGVVTLILGFYIVITS